MYLSILGALLNKELLSISIIKISDFLIIPSDLIAFFGERWKFRRKIDTFSN